MNTPKSSLLLGNSSIQVRRDIKHRILFELYEKERQLLKKERSNLNNSLTIRLNAQQNLDKLLGMSNKIKNRCILTGCSRSITRQFKLSRIMIKELACYGLLPGIRKSH